MRPRAIVINDRAIDEGGAIFGKSQFEVTSGLPPGVLNVVAGDGPTLGVADLALHLSIQVE